MRCGRSGNERSHHALAGLGTGRAGLGADPAVLHVLAMTGALIAAGAADGGARLEQRLECGLIAAARAGDQTRGDLAEVRAVEVQSDALRQLLCIRFGEAGVGADGAGGGALRAGADAGHGLVARAAGRVRVGVQHPLKALH